MPTVTASATTAVDAAPASPESLWMLSRLLLHDWSSPIIVTTSWPSGTASSSTAAETRRCPIGKPLRTIQFALYGGRSAEESRLIRLGLYRSGTCRSLVPLWCDQTYLTAAASGTTLTCDTTLRRLFAGARVAVVAPSVCNATVYEVATIESLTATTITLAAGLSRTYPNDSRVLPLIECDVQPTSDATVVNGRLVAQVSAAEVPGASALPAIADPGATLTAFGSYGGTIVFDPGLPTTGRLFDWHATGIGFDRDSRSAKAGQGTSYSLFGPRPRLTNKRTAAPVLRANAWPLLQMFDVARGGTFPFLSPDPISLATPLAVTSTAVQVPAAGPLSDWSAVPYLAVITRGVGPAQVRVRPISLSTPPTRAGAVDTITLADPLDVTADIHSVAACHLMRFDSADLTETWGTTGNLSIGFGLVEVLGEAQAIISNL